jgi:shikimate kinase
MERKIYLTGMPGCGKSKVGRILAERLHLPFVDLDVVIAGAEGMEINRIFAERGEPWFRELEARWLRESSAVPAFVMATGGGAPCFYGNMEYMNGAGISVFLDVPLERPVRSADPAGHFQTAAPETPG